MHKGHKGQAQGMHIAGKAVRTSGQGHRKHLNLQCPLSSVPGRMRVHRQVQVQWQCLVRVPIAAADAGKDTLRC